jgi:hypothetical protein
MTDPAYLHPIQRSPIPISEVTDLTVVLDNYAQAINNHTAMLTKVKHSISTLWMLIVIILVSTWMPWIVGWLRWWW